MMMMMSAVRYEDVVTCIAHQLKCPICFEVFSHPVTLACGHSYCLQCINNHLKQSARRRECPQCRAELRTSCRLHKNVTIAAILELHGAGGPGVWDRVLTGSDEELGQDALQRRLDLLQQEIKKVESLLSESHSNIQNGRCFIRDRIRPQETPETPNVLSSSPDPEGGSPCAEESLGPPSVAQGDEVDQTVEFGSEESGARVSEDPDSLSGGTTSAAAALSAEFVSLYISPRLSHRRLVFIPQTRRVEVRSQRLRPQLGHFEASQCMAEQEFTTGRHYWDVETSACSGWAAGVAYAHLGKAERLGRSKSSWCIEWSNCRFSVWHDGSETQLKQTHPSRLRVLLDMDGGRLSFWTGADAETELYYFWVKFRGPVRPAFWLFGTKVGNALSFPGP
ncbi:E3 ubiquitin/ISG15 ligase TRIM25 isoform X1 [Clarias gariepinus]|uniref:E3 ubiquitin/ISG15 ligase TRIM25 isoform X1 n=1 Tax=Clarias gariepinus TaxID=13013 RepID=UPI00234D31B4|nr:E3 ubiquitin/ISG15 ligase TRIM25 isoform X1 [Clarias gariepinus]